MTHDLIVIGAGSAGLTAAGGAAMFGLKVALIEQSAMGGECLNTGCVPSKALLAAAKRAQCAREPTRMGVTLPDAEVDFAGVHRYLHDCIAAIAPRDSQARFEAMGVDVFRDTARFVGRREVMVGDRRLAAPRVVIATGSRPAIPDVPGLAAIPYLTNETLFALDTLPDHLVIIGGGAIGVEMAQAFRRLGSAVTMVVRGTLLARDDADAAALVTYRLTREGVTILSNCSATHAAREGNGLRLMLDNGTTIVGSHLLVATGRRANVDTLDLAAAGVVHGKRGIVVNARRRTSNRCIYAIGDCRDGPRFTHVAGYEGSLVAVAVALGWAGKVDWRALPHVTYCDPELAQIGLTEAEARDQHGDVDVTCEDVADNDRAVTEGDTTGFLKLVRHRGRVVGVTIVGAHAGELLLPWTQVITGKTSTFALGSAIVAYPTRSELAKAAAFATLQPTVFGIWPNRWARFLARVRR